MGVINSPLVEGGVFSEEVNKKEVTVNGVNSNKKSVRITIILHTLFCLLYTSPSPRDYRSSGIPSSA